MKPWEKYGENQESESSPSLDAALPWEKYSTPKEEKSERRSFSDELGRQIGLTARYGLEGLGQVADVVTEPLRVAVVNPIARAIGLPEADRSTGQLAKTISDAAGLPSPEGSTERVVGDATRLMAGTGGLAGIAGKTGQYSNGVTKKAAQWIADNPLQQVSSAAGSGAAGGAVREGGGSESAQAAAALLGGVGASLLTQAIANSASKTVSRLTTKRAENIENQIEINLNKSGVDWSDVPDKIKSSMRKEVEKALKTGDDLDPTAIRRLLDFKRVNGTTPTRGSLTLDPVQITREQNLARMGANSTDDGLQGLARIQNENNQKLIQSMNSLGANTGDDAYAAGNKVIGSLRNGIDSEQANINQLYSQARDSAGRSVPLDGYTFSQRANNMIDEAMVGGALPADVRNHINRIAQGQVPFDVNYAEQLKTRIGKLQRSTNDGQTRYALGLVRQALDETPMLNSGGQAARQSPILNTDGLPIVANRSAIDVPQGSVGQEAIDAFNSARGANRQMMQRIESNPALQAIYNEGATPEKFVSKFITSQSASVDDVRKLAAQIGSDPEAVTAVRNSIAQHLKSAAIGKGTTDEIGKFSASNFRNALQSIGERKLSAFFTKEEIEQLKAVANVANYTSAQPVGSAVNNSNSGALILGRGIDMLNKLSEKIPLFGVGPTISGFIKSGQQRAAQNIAPALTSSSKRVGLSSAIRPAATLGSLFAVSPSVNSRENDQ